MFLILNHPCAKTLKGIITKRQKTKDFFIYNLLSIVFDHSKGSSYELGALLKFKADFFAHCPNLILIQKKSISKQTSHNAYSPLMFASQEFNCLFYI